MKQLLNTARNGAQLILDTFWVSKYAKAQSLGLVIVFAFIAFYFPNYTGSYTPLFVAWTMSYVVLAVSWNFFSGKTGYISLATAAFYGIGVYVQAVYGRQIPLAGIMLISAVLSFGVGYGIGSPTIQTVATQSVPPERRGSVSATFFFGIDFAFVLGPFVGGNIAEAAGYGAGYLWFAIPPLLVVPFSFILERKKVSIKERKKA